MNKWIFRSIAFASLIAVLAVAVWLVLPLLIPELAITRAPPRHVSADPPEAPSLSTLSVRIQVPLAELEQYANEEIPDELVDKADRKGRMRSHVRVHRDGPVQLRGKGRTLTLAVPVRFRATAKLKSIIKPGTHTSGKATIFLDIGLSLDPQWRVQLDIDPRFRWNRKPKLRLGPIKIDVSKEIGKDLQKALDKAARKAAAKAAEKYNLRADAEKEWIKVHSRHELHNDPPVWLTTDPESVFIAPVTSDGEYVQLAFGMTTYLNTVIGGPPEPPASEPLPSLSQAAGDTGYFFIHVPAVIEYSGLEQKLKKSLVGKRLQLPQGTITPTDFTVYPSGDKLVLGVSFDGEGSGWWLDTNGTVYLAGTPVYDSETKIVRVDQFDFTRKLSNPLVGTAAWVLQDSLREQLQTRLVYDLTENIARARANLDAFLDRSISDKLLMSGAVSDLSISGIRMELEGMVVGLSAKGTLSIEAKP